MTHPDIIRMENTGLKPFESYEDYAMCDNYDPWLHERNWDDE